MKIVLFGTGNFGIIGLSMLKSEGMDVTLVTTPARPQGRGLKADFNEIYYAALAARIPIICEDNIKDTHFIQKIASLCPRLLIVVDYGKIVPAVLINIPGCRAVNIHPSLLPSHRGATPIQTSLLNNEEETGVTIQTLSEKVDAGDIIYQERTMILGEDNYGTLENRLKGISVKLLKLLLQDPDHEGLKQDPSKVTLCKKVGKEDLIVDWSMSAVSINNHVRAFHSPQPGMKTLFKGKSVRLITTMAIGDIPGRTVSPRLPGTINHFSKDKLVINTGAGLLSIIELQPENKKPMKVSDFINGYRPEIGELLGA